jgi:MFS family permease
MLTNLIFRVALQPLFGQMAGIFDRRWVTLFIVAMFTLGSGICGGAINGDILITGKSIQDRSWRY